MFVHDYKFSGQLYVTGIDYNRKYKKKRIEDLAQVFCKRTREAKRGKKDEYKRKGVKGRKKIEERYGKRKRGRSGRGKNERKNEEIKKDKGSQRREEMKGCKYKLLY